MARTTDLASISKKRKENDMGVKLKPCPFCNGSAEVKDRYRKGVANRKMYWVECKQCGVSQAHHDLAGYKTPNRAIAVWNHRIQLVLYDKPITTMGIGE